MKAKIRCVFCKGDKHIKKGFRKTEHRGKIQKYKCLSCGKYFTNNDGFYRMRNSESIITMSVDMYLSNLSSRKMRNQLKRHMNTKISHVSVLAWVRRYVLMVQKFVDHLQPQLSGRIYADETEVDCQRRKDVFWCAVDWDTRFINSTLYSHNPQNMKDAIEFMKKIKESVEPIYVQTDGLVHYPRAFRKVFFRMDREIPEHKINNVQKTRKHNVRIESVFMKIKDRVYDFRGFKALWSASILMTGLVIQHNFIESHMGTGKVPCELAGLNMDTGIDRWMGLIKLASF